MPDKSRILFDLAASRLSGYDPGVRTSAFDPTKVERINPNYADCIVSPELIKVAAL